VRAALRAWRALACLEKSVSLSLTALHAATLGRISLRSRVLTNTLRVVLLIGYLSFFHIFSLIISIFLVDVFDRGM